LTATPGKQESCARGGKGGADLREGPEEGGGGDGVGGGHWETEELGASREDKVEGTRRRIWRHSGEVRRGLEMRLRGFIRRRVGARLREGDGVWRQMG
jgi:hypothetical protein